MQIQILNEQFATTGQIQPSDLATLKEMGFQTLVCNRPDDEELGQPNFQTLQTIAQEMGFNCHYIPIQTPHDLPEAAKILASTLPQSTPKILLYCRSGQRSQKLYQYYTDHQ